MITSVKDKLFALLCLNEKQSNCDKKTTVVESGIHSTNKSSSELKKSKCNNDNITLPNIVSDNYGKIFTNIRYKQILFEADTSDKFSEIYSGSIQYLERCCDDKEYKDLLLNINNYINNIYYQCVYIFVKSFKSLVDTNDHYKKTFHCLHHILYTWNNNIEGKDKLKEYEYKSFVNDLSELGKEVISIDKLSIYDFYYNNIYEKYYKFYFDEISSLNEKINKIQKNSKPHINENITNKKDNSEYSSENILNSGLDDIAINLNNLTTEVYKILENDFISVSEYEKYIDILDNNSHFLYDACVGTTVQSFDKSYAGGTINKNQFENIEWLLEKWKNHVIVLGKKVDENDYCEFLDDLDKIDNTKFEYEGKDLSTFYQINIFDSLFKDFKDLYDHLRIEVQKKFDNNYLKKISGDSPVEYVYIVSNESMPEIVKIGKTNNIERRLVELQGTGVPTPFKIEKLWKCKVSLDYERYLHEKYSDSRVSENREFFYSNILENIEHDQDLLNIDSVEIEKNKIIEKYINEYPTYYIRHTGTIHDILNAYNSRFYFTYISKTNTNTLQRITNIQNRIDAFPDSKNNLVLENEIIYLSKMINMRLQLHNDGTLMKILEERLPTSITH